MAERLLIYPLDLADFTPPDLPTQTEFTDLVNQELGDSASAADGFDQVLQDLSDIIDSLEGGLVLLGGADGGDLDDTFIEALEIDPGLPGANLAAGAALVPAGDAIITDLGNLLTSVTLPPPPTAQPAQCTPVDFGTIPLGSTKTLIVTFQNSSGTTLTVRHLVVAGNNTANIFIVTPNYQNQVLAPGATIALHINGDPDGSSQGQKFSSTLTLQTDHPDPQPCLLLLAVAGAGTPSQPGGGGGGGGDGGGGTCHLVLQGGQVRCVF
jgi:hypothetical protein